MPSSSTNLDNYEGPAQCFINGRLLAEATTLRVSVKGNNRPVVTMQKGLAGKSDGPRMSSFSVEEAIPVAGYEVDFMTLCIRGTYVRFVYVMGGQRKQVIGWIDEVDDGTGSEQTASTSFNGTGGVPTILPA